VEWLPARNRSGDGLNYDGTGESWSWGDGSDESGGGSSYLGVDIADVSPERLGELKLKEEHGAEVTMVDQDAPAGKAGLHEHDVIVSLNGTAIESAAQLRRMIKETPPGRVVNLGISRDGQA
jgi:serine protease Do